MSDDTLKHHRRSIRLKRYDYTQPGAYFVTIVTQERECSLGEIVHNEMVVSPMGKIVLDTWDWLASQYTYVTLDEFCVMPNHFHGVIVINDAGICKGDIDTDICRGGTDTDMGRGDTGADVCRGGSRTAPTNTTKTKPLGRLIGAFKTVSTKRINEMRGTPGATVWQRNYYEHIIRNEDELGRIRTYIAANPASWQEDDEYAV